MQVYLFIYLLKPWPAGSLPGVDLKAEGLDKVQGDAGCRAGPRNGASILWDLRVDQHHMQVLSKRQIPVRKYSFNASAGE